MTVSTTPRVQAQPLAEQAYLRLRDDIVHLRLEPGAPVDDKQISAELGIGLTPVRDALKRLTLERMVVTYPRRGTFVAEITVSDEEWLTELRHNLEGLAAGLAAERATRDERAHLEELAGGLALDHANHLTAEYHALDARIHRAIYVAAHNPFLETSLNQYLNLTLRIWHHGLRRVPAKRSVGEDQQAVISAIVRGDSVTATEAAKAHLGNYSGAVRPLLFR